MRVLTVLTSYAMGGAERYVSRMTPLLLARGIEVEVLVLDARGPLREAFEGSGALLHRSVFERPGGTAARLWNTVSEIRRLVRRGRFDAVHTYLYWADTLGAVGAALAGCPRRIITRRGHHDVRHDPGGGRELMDLASRLAATELIANSRSLLADAEAHHRVLPRTRTVIHNGVDVAAYTPARISAVGPLRLVSVGTLAAHKGHEHLVRALRLARAGGVDATLTLVGAGPEEQRLRDLAADAGEAVIFAGQTLDPRPHLQAGDVFVLPSREGFSNALLEAMASALPVIATDEGGSPEALIDGVGGRLVTPGSAEALAAAITDLAAMRSLLGGMGAANRERVERNFTLAISADRLAAWYRAGPHPADREAG